MSAPEVLMEGVVFDESPRWHAGRLWFSDWGAHQVIALDPGGGHEAVVSVPSFPLCIDFLPDGRLLLVDSARLLLLRREPGGSLGTHADLSGISDKPERHRGRRARQRLRQLHRLRLPRRPVRPRPDRARHPGRRRHRQQLRIAERERSAGRRADRGKVRPVPEHVIDLDVHCSSEGLDVVFHNSIMETLASSCGPSPWNHSSSGQLCQPGMGEAGQVRDAHRGERTWISSVALAAAPGSAPTPAGSRTAARRR